MKNKKLGDLIYDLRMSKKLSQENVANAAKVSRQTVSKWEANKSQPKSANLLRVSEALGVDITYFSLKQNDTSAEKDATVAIVNTVENTDKEISPETEVVSDKVANDDTQSANSLEIVEVLTTEDVAIQEAPKVTKGNLSKKKNVSIVVALIILVLLVGIAFLVYDVTTTIPDAKGSFGDISTKVTMNFSIENIGWILFGTSLSIAAILGIVLLYKRLKNKKNNKEMAESH